MPSTKDLPSKAEGIEWCSAFAMEAVLIVAGNLLTIVLFALHRNLRKKSLFFVVKMAFADLIVGALTVPHYIYRTGNDYQLWTTNAHTFIRTISLTIALISAALISGERFYAIYWSLKHRILTMRAYRIAIFRAVGHWRSLFLQPFSLIIKILNFKQT